MIRAEFFSRAGEPAGFCIGGHSGEAGSAVVCAAVSSAAYLAANTVTDVIGAKAGVSAAEGRMSCRIPPESAARCRDILLGLEAHLNGLKDQYPGEIEVIHTEV